MESVFSSVKFQGIGHKTVWTRDDARTDVFDDIERCYKLYCRH